MSQTIVLDTNILIDFLRSNDRAIAYVDSLNEDIPVLISVITAAELFAGVQGAAEMNHLSSVLDLYEIIPIDTSLAQKGGLIKNEFFKSHGTGIGDAIIAATALQHNATLITLNLKHFPMVDKKRAPY